MMMMARLVCVGMKDTVLKCFNAIGKAYQLPDVEKHERA
jgi:hypothetical protein